MKTIITKTSTAAQVISLCAIRRTRLRTDRKGGYTEIKHTSRGHRHDDQPTPPSAA